MQPRGAWRCRPTGATLGRAPVADARTGGPHAMDDLIADSPARAEAMCEVPALPHPTRRKPRRKRCSRSRRGSTTSAGGDLSRLGTVIASNQALQTYRSMKRRFGDVSTDTSVERSDPRTTSVIAGTRLDLLDALEQLERDHPAAVEALILRDSARCPTSRSPGLTGTPWARSKPASTRPGDTSARRLSGQRQLSDTSCIEVGDRPSGEGKHHDEEADRRPRPRSASSVASAWRGGKRVDAGPAVRGCPDPDPGRRAAARRRGQEAGARDERRRNRDLVGHVGQPHQEGPEDQQRDEWAGRGPGRPADARARRSAERGDRARGADPDREWATATDFESAIGCRSDRRSR